MHDTQPPKPTRRQWISGLGRWVAGILLVVTSGWLALRNRDNCNNAYQCRHCPVRGGCNLPEAMAYQNKERSADPADRQSP